MDSNQNPSTEKKTWDSLGISLNTIEILTRNGLLNPTPIQESAIPIALSGTDLIASAQTGTGKTASFVIPLIEKIKGREGTLGLILAPTREVAQQIQVVVDKLGTPQGVRSIVLIGGVNMKQDAAALASYPQVIVATPGRLCDHLERGQVWLDFIDMVILDEADRMLDMGFADQLAKIMKDIPGSAQTLVFSATIPPSVDRLAKGILYNPKYVKIGHSNAAASTVEQKLLWMHEEFKSRALRSLLETEKGTILVFTRSKDGASRLFRSLHSRGFMEATVIHSDLRQMDREKALADFKSGKFRVLIATDIAGRGIHVDGIAHVINYDLPHEPEDYVHRIGRTGRSSMSGKATSFATFRDKALVGAIERLVRAKIPSEVTESFDQRPARPSNSRPHPKGGPKRHPRKPGGH